MNWDKMQEAFTKRAEQSSRHTYEKAEIKHELDIAKLEESALHISVDKVQKGREVLEMLRKRQ